MSDFNVDEIAQISKCRNKKTKFVSSIKRLFPVFIMVPLGVVLSVFIFTLLSSSDKQEIRLAFEQNASVEVKIIEDAIESSIAITGTVGTYFDSLGSVSRAQFARFTAPFRARQGSIHALEWIPRVRAEQRQSYETAAQVEGLEDFVITEQATQGEMTPAGNRSEYFPVYYVEPLDGNRLAAGFDLASNQRRLTALNQARDTGAQVATAKITLVQETEKQSGFLVFDPVYESGNTPLSVEDRRQQLKGFSLAVMRVGDMIENAIRSETSRLQRQIVDVTQEGAEETLYDPIDRGQMDSVLSYVQDIPVAGRLWRVTIRPGPGYYQLETAQASWFALILCLLLTASLSIYLSQLLNGRDRIAQQVELKTRALKKSENRLEKTAAKSEITRVAAEAALAELASQKFAMDEHSIVTVTNVSGTITYANDKFCDISQYSRDEAIGANQRIINSGYHPASIFDEMYQIIASGKTWHSEFKNRAKDGSDYWVDTTISPFKDSNGEIFQYVVIQTDITKSKHIEEELEQSNSELQHANTDLKKFAYVASHDLQEPLRKLQQFSEFLKEDCSDELSEDALYFLKVIGDSSSRMSRLIKDLLIYSRTANRDLELIEIDLGKTAEHIVSEFDLLISETNADIQIDLLPSIMGDRVAIEHLLRNLIGNAIKYRHMDRDPQVWVTVALQKEAEIVELQVIDNGIGFDQTYSQRIMEPFHRLHNKSEYEGSGIGLAVCNTICKKHGWRLEANSKIGDGSTFSVFIPQIKKLG